jgi:hypothetical protein
MRRITKTLNSDVYTIARLRDTIKNSGFRIDTNACVLSDETTGDCRFADLSHTMFRPVSIILIQSWSKGIKAQSITKCLISNLNLSYTDDKAFQRTLPLLHNFVNNALYGHVCILSKPVEIVNAIEKVIYIEFN